MNSAIKKSLLEVDYGRHLLNMYWITFADYRKKHKLILHYSHKNIENLCDYLLQFLGSEISVQFQRLHRSSLLHNFGNEVLHGIILIHRKQTNDVLECLMRLVELPANAVVAYSEPPSSEYDRSSEISDFACNMDVLYINDVNLVDNPNVVKDIRYITMSEDEDFTPRGIIDDEQVLKANPIFFKNFCNADEEQFQRFTEEFENNYNEALELSLPGKSVESDFTEVSKLSEVELDQPEDRQPSKKRVFRCHYEDVLQQNDLENFQFKQPLPASMFHYDDLSSDEREPAEGPLVTPQPKRVKRGRIHQPIMNEVTTLSSNLLHKRNCDSEWKIKKQRLWELSNVVPSFDLDEPFVTMETLIQFEDVVKEVAALEEEELIDRPLSSLGELAVLLRAETLRTYLLPKGIGDIQEHIDLPMVPLHERLIHPVSELEGQIPEGMDITAHPSNITGATLLGPEISVALDGTIHQSRFFGIGAVEGSPPKRQRIRSLIQDAKSLQFQGEPMPMFQEQPLIVDQQLQMFEPLPEVLPQEQMVIEPPLVEQPPLQPMPELSPRRFRAPRLETGVYEGQGDMTSPRRRKPRRRRRLVAEPEGDELLAVPLPLEEQIGYEESGQVLELDLSFRDWTKEYLWDKLKNVRRILKFTDICPRGTNRFTAVKVFHLLIKMCAERLISLNQEDPAGNPDEIYIIVSQE